MSIATKNIAPFKELIKNLTKELTIINEKSSKIHNEKDIKKQIALLNYKKLNLIKERQSVKEIDEKLVKLNNGEVPITPLDTTIVEKLVDENTPHITPQYKSFHLHNMATFLASQRVYQELLERYNPGLTMTQEDNVRKTANRVGLQVPKN